MSVVLEWKGLVGRKIRGDGKWMLTDGLGGSESEKTIVLVKG